MARKEGKGSKESQLVEVAAVLPHAHPMILIDTVTPLSPAATRSSVRVGEDSPFFEAPHGVPAYVGLEYIAQTVAAHGGLRARAAGEPVQIGFLLGTRRYDCATAYFPLGACLAIDVQSVYESSTLAKFNGVISDAGDADATALASCALTVYQRTGAAGEP